jgi:signal transduction histidine kinase
LVKHDGNYPERHGFEHAAWFADNSPHPVMEVDGSGRLLAANASAERRFSSLAREGSGHPLLRDLEQVLGELRRRGAAMLVREVECDERYFEQTIHYHEDADVAQLLFYEVTTHHQAHSRLQHSLAELGRAQGIAAVMEDLEQFARAASHDLQSPLQSALNLVSWLREELGDDPPPRVREYLGLLEQRVARMQRLLWVLRKYLDADRHAASMQLVDTAEILHDVLARRDTARRFKLDVRSEMPTLLTAHSNLEQVFDAIISNAVVHHHLHHGVLTVSAAERGEHYEFVVEDDGPGIPEAFRSKAFNLFATLRRRDEHDTNGAGLAIARKLVRSAGGEISIGSALPHGCAVRFTWPRTWVNVEATTRRWARMAKLLNEENEDELEL